MSDEVPVPLTGDEMDLVEQIAKRDGRTIEEVAAELISDGIARRIRKNTGRGPAKVYPIHGRRNDD